LAGTTQTAFLIENGHDPVLVQRMLRQSHVDMTMHYMHNSHKATNAQTQFIEPFLPNGGAGADVEEPGDAKRVPLRVLEFCANKQVL
jgi:triphosphoribosyl-dephospho-CoA synthetase